MSEELKFQPLKPPPECFRVFKNKQRATGVAGRYAHSGAPINNLLDPKHPVSFPPEGGIFIHRIGSSLPIRGLPYFEACWANDLVKSDIIGWIRILSDSLFFPSWFLFPFLTPKTKIRKIENLLGRLVHRTSFAMENHILEDQFMKPAAFEIRKLAYGFMYYLGIEEQIAYETADIPCFIVEYDDTYCLRVEDIFSLTTKERLLKNPIREVRRIMTIGLSREQDTPDLKRKLEAIRTIFTLIMLSPQVRKAFRKSLKEIDFPKLCLDKIETYATLVAGEGYKYLGKTNDERLKMLKDQYGEDPHKRYYIK